MKQASDYQSIFKEIRQSLKLSLPLILTYLIQSSSGFIGTVMIAHLSTDALAAGALVGGIYMTIIVFMFGLLAAVSVLVSQNYGAKKDDSVGLATSQGLIVSLMVTIPIVIALWFSPVILRLSGQNAEVITLSVKYLHALTWGIIPLGVLVVLEQFFIGISKTRIVLGFSLIQVPMEIFCSYVLIFGKFGFPKLGIAGLGYGFAFAFSVAAVGISFFAAYGKHVKKFHVFSHVQQINWQYIWELFRIGTPIGMMYIIEVAFSLVMAFMMGHFGVAKLAAHQIVSQFAGFTFMIIMGISNAATVSVGHAVGRQDLVGVKRAAYVNQGVGLCIILFIALVYWFFAKDIMAVDINVVAKANLQLVQYAILFFAIMAFAQIGDMCRFTTIGILRGLKDTKIPLYVSAFVFWCVALPVAYLLAFKWHFNGAGLWIGLVIGIMIGAGILWVRFRRLLHRINLQKVLI